jgi:hypothetical protein
MKRSCVALINEHMRDYTYECLLIQNTREQHNVGGDGASNLPFGANLQAREVGEAELEAVLVLKVSLDRDLRVIHEADSVALGGQPLRPS